MEQNGNGYYSSSSPFEASVSHTRNASFRHLNQRHLLPKTSSQNPNEDNIEYLFSQLSVSQHNGEPSYPAAYSDSSVGSHLYRPHVGGQTFSVQEMGQNQQNNGLNSFLSMGLQDYLSYPDMRGSNIDFGNSFISNVNELPWADSSGFSNGSMTDCWLSKIRNSHSSTLYDERPHWLQEPSNYLPLGDLRGMILRLAKDQNGCRLLQSVLGRGAKVGIGIVFFEVIEYVGELMVDPFGNYVIQKLVQVCSEEQRSQILLRVTRSEFQLVRICIDTHGTRAVQKLLETITSQQQISVFMSAISPSAVVLAKNINGHHVIKHCLRYFSIENNKYLLNVVADNCFEIAIDKSGCCVLQLCVDNSRGEARDRLISEITANALLLAEDPYGNYVVQHILALKFPRITANLLKQLQGSFIVLACNKYGSNVVEKCLVESNKEQFAQIIWELLRSSNASMLLVDSFGNYVVQSAISKSEGPAFVALLELIQMNVPRMRNNIYGRKILLKLRERGIHF